MSRDQTKIIYEKPMLSRLRVIILSIIILIIFIPYENTSSIWSIALGLAMFLAYLLLLIWPPSGRLSSSRNYIAIIIILWLITLLSWIVFDTERTSASLMIYLVAYIALRLSGMVAAVLAAIITAVSVLMLYFMSHSPDYGVGVYALLLVGIYVIFWGARMRREAHQQLSMMHRELEQTHLELKRAHLELEEATSRLLQYAVLEERTRIARDIHDSIGHGLTSVIVQLQALPYMMQANPEEAERATSNVLNVARNCLAEVRTVVHQMADQNMIYGGINALKQLCDQVREQSQLSITFDTVEAEGQWSAATTELLYRVLQEALTNVIRHAEATKVEITIAERDGVIAMIVQDNGLNNLKMPVVPGFGLSNMKMRCEAVGGTMQVDTLHPHGIAISVSIPIHYKATEELANEER